MPNVLNDYKVEETILFPRNIRFHSDLTFGEKIFLAEIQSMSSRGNYPKLCSSSLSKLFGVSHQTIINWVKKLTNMGLIEADSSNPYNLTLKSKINTF
jgi:Mn-dependent DtxR family transcriptional regulator